MFALSRIVAREATTVLSVRFVRQSTSVRSSSVAREISAVCAIVEEVIFAYETQFPERRMEVQVSGIGIVLVISFQGGEVQLSRESPTGREVIPCQYSQTEVGIVKIETLFELIPLGVVLI